MTDKPISVYFNMLDKNDNTFNGLHTEVTHLNQEQAQQIIDNLASAQHPMRKYCLYKTTASLSSDGKMLTINQKFDTQTLDDENHIFMSCTKSWCNCPETIHKKCIKNLSQGKCQNQYMRDTVGVILFPKLYNQENQKQK